MLSSFSRSKVPTDKSDGQRYQTTLYQLPGSTYVHLVLYLYIRKFSTDKVLLSKKCTFLILMDSASAIFFTASNPRHIAFDLDIEQALSSFH